MSVELSELDFLVEQLVDLKQAKKRLEDEAKAIEDRVRIHQGKILAALDEAKLPNFRGSRGLVSVVEQTSYKLPADEDAMEMLRNHLESIGLRSMLKPNSISLNSWAKREYEAAKENGNPFFEIPGLDQPIVTKTLSLREAK